MRQIILAFFSLFLVASLGAQERKAQRIEFFYQSGAAYNHTVGDTIVGGLSASPDTAHTIYFSGTTKDKRVFDSIVIAVDKDTTFVTGDDKTDTTTVWIYRGVGGFYSDIPDTASVAAQLNAGSYIATDVLGFVTQTFMFEIDATVGAFVATNYKLVISHAHMASGDSTSYRIRMVGIYSDQ